MFPDIVGSHIFKLSFLSTVSILVFYHVVSLFHITPSAALISLPFYYKHSEQKRKMFNINRMSYDSHPSEIDLDRQAHCHSYRPCPRTRVVDDETLAWF